MTNGAEASSLCAPNNTLYGEKWSERKENTPKTNSCLEQNKQKSRRKLQPKHIGIYQIQLDS